MSKTLSSLLARIQNKTATVGIIGLGYVGLPLARAFAHAGFRVLGFDIDTAKVAKLNAGKSFIKQIPDETVAGMRAAGFEATDSFARLNEPDAILICVPTPLTEAREPDLTYVVNSANAISGRLATRPTGDPRKHNVPQYHTRRHAAGVGAYGAWSRARISSWRSARSVKTPGNPTHSVTHVPKVVGGLDDASGDAACALYSAIVPKVVRVSTPEVAEACKILENTYRAINIALVNEMKVLYDRMGIDVWEVIDAAKTKPFGFQAFYPGPGLGGHCIPLDPFYLSWIARHHGMSTRFIELAGEVNTAMPAYVITKVTDALNDAGKAVRGSKVALLGMAYKKDIDDPRESPSFELLDLLLKKGAAVSYNDPHIPSLPRMRHWPHLDPMMSQPLTAEYLAEQDCVLIATDHTAYDYAFIVKHSRLVIDTRNATRPVTAGREKIVRA